MEIWFEGKAFNFPSTTPEDEIIIEFRGPDAGDKADAWFAAQKDMPFIDAVYLYQLSKGPAEIGDGVGKVMVNAWSRTYDGVSYYGDPDADDPHEFQLDGWDDL